MVAASLYQVENEIVLLTSEMSLIAKLPSHAFPLEAQRHILQHGVIT